MSPPNFRSWIVYPFLFGLYPVLSLIAHNIAEMPISSGLRAVLISLILTVSLYFLLVWLIKNRQKAALITTLLVLILFAYGQIYLLVREADGLGNLLGRHRVLFPLLLILCAILIWLILRSRRDLTSFTQALNLFAIVLIILPLFQIIAFEVRDHLSSQQRQSDLANANQLQASQGQPLPDIYYIVLDSYPRSDFICTYLGIDNRAFLDALRQQGFYIADCSQSNYTDTRFSIASTLNMTYLDSGNGLPEVNLNGSQVDNLIRYASMVRQLKELGYEIITYESGFKWLRLADTDQYLSPRQQKINLWESLGLNDFENLYLNTTIGRMALDFGVLSAANPANRLEKLIANPRAVHRERVLFTLDSLPKLAQNKDSPKFVYAHLIFPHPPFVLDADGNPVENTPPDELKAYADQITYLDSRLIEIVDQMISDSAVPPVIILQGDHGVTIDYAAQDIDKTDRLAILNAYYLPGLPAGSLYPTISPVNTFRLVLDQYFQAGLPLLEDRSIIGRQSPFTQLPCPIPSK